MRLLVVEDEPGTPYAPCGRRLPRSHTRRAQGGTEGAGRAVAAPRPSPLEEVFGSSGIYPIE
jgi:hypothetical protein